MLPNLPLLYIDPGTGSALFSIIIGITAVAFFAFQAIFIKAKIFFSGGRAKTGAKNKYVIYAEDKRYFTLFKPIIKEFENSEKELLYLTSSKDDPVFDAGFKYIKPEYIGEGNKAFARLNFLSADFVLATTPGLDVYQWKRSKNVKHYSHIFHAPTENAFYEVFSLDYFDSVLITGDDYQKDHIRKLEKFRNLPEKEIVTVGCPYLDEYALKIEDVPNEDSPPFTVLVSPTWGASSLLSKFGDKLLDPLLKTGWRIIVRPHPQSLLTEKNVIDNLIKKYSDISSLEWDFKSENIYSLKKADVMISDYSGIILDFLFLREKPVFYFLKNYDMSAYDAFDIYKSQEDVWTFGQIKKTCIELEPGLLDNLADIIEKSAKSSAIKKNIADFKQKAWHFQNEAGKNIFNFMIKKGENN